MAEAKSKAKGGFKQAAPTPATPRVDPAAGTVDEVKVTHLQVRALTNGFRRAGRAWSARDEIVPIGEFTPEQVEQLLAESQLVVLPIAEKTEEAK